MGMYFPLGTGGGGGITTEDAQDAIANLLVAGTGITLSYDDTANTLTVTSTGGLTQEQVEDFVGALVQDTSDIDVTYTDNGTSAGAITLAIKTGAVTNAMLAGSIALAKLATDPLARANHTGTQAASTISDFSEAVDDRVASLIVAGTNLTVTYNDAGNTLTIDGPSPEQPVTTINPTGASETIDMAGAETVIVNATLGADTTFTITNWPSTGHLGQVIFRFIQDATGNRKPTIAGVDQWVEDQLSPPPVINPDVDALTTATVYSINAGSTMYGSSGQVVREHRYNLSGTLTDGFTGSIPERIKNYGRIIEIWVEAGTAPSGGSGVFDVNLDGTTVYTTQANRPTLTTGTSYVNATLPDVVDVTPGQKLTVDCDTAHSVANVQVVVRTLEMA